MQVDIYFSHVLNDTKFKLKILSLLDIAFPLVHKQTITNKQLAMKTTLAVLLFHFGMHSVVDFHMKQDKHSACLKLCTSVMRSRCQL